MEGRGILAKICGSRDERVGFDPEGARSPSCARRLHRSRRKPAARGDARRRRRFRTKTLRIPRGRGRGRGRHLAAPLGQMDRGPPRAFHQRGAGARPVLVDRDRGGSGWPRARHTRPAGARSRRLCAAGREPAVQFRKHPERPVCGAGAGDRRGGDPHQQGAGLLGARRRLSAGRVRHGAVDGPPRARRLASTAPNCAAAI